MRFVILLAVHSFGPENRFVTRFEIAPRISILAGALWRGSRLLGPKRKADPEVCMLSKTGEEERDGVSLQHAGLPLFGHTYMYLDIQWHTQVVHTCTLFSWYSENSDKAGVVLNIWSRALIAR